MPDVGLDSALPETATWESVARRAVDLTVAILALLVLAVPLIVIGLVIRWTSVGPALFQQQRVGFGGKTFTMYKFRTMRTGVGDEMLRELIAAELRGEDTSVDGSYKLDSDPRVTPIGAFLRKTSLDELPQLLNVLFGDMSLVGPRPPLPSEVAWYDQDVARRLLVKPGMTGLWQVSGRSDLSWEDGIRLDLYYVENWSLATDLSILWKTLGAVIGSRGAY